MLTKIIDFSARNRYLVILLTAMLLGIAYWTTRNMPLDALPDLSDTQVIIYSEWERSPDIIEDQVTYPIVAALLGAPGVKSIRGISDYGYSYIYVIFEDGTDIYWARSRVLEYLSQITPRLPDGVQVELGPDATGVGWVYQYALIDRTGKHDLAELRSLQDWNLRFQLQSIEGVAEVASIGGFVKQYQVLINPASLISYDIPITRVVEAIRNSNEEVGGRVVEFSGREYMVRGRGYLSSLNDIENVVVGLNQQTGTPVLVRHLGRVEIGPDMRRGVADLDGEGDAVGGIIVMRHGENALNVIRRIKSKIEEIKPFLPQGVEIVEVYDRSDLIERAIRTLKITLTEELIIVSLMILLFLWHIPSASVAILSIPISVTLAFIPLYMMGLTTNIMSLAGIAISIGVLVDGAIIEVENAYKKIERWKSEGAVGDFFEVRLNALKEVGPSVFFSLLVIAVSFMPIFTLVDQEGRLFKPLAYSKNITMAIAALSALTLDPALRMLFSRYKPFTFKPVWLAKIASACLVGSYYPEEHHPVSKRLFRIYEPACRWVLEHRMKALAITALLTLSTVPVYMKLGSEFMPPLNEGSILYMPTTLPGISVTEAERVMQIQDRLIRSVPEVERVYGKAGRARTATDPAPFSMIETTIVLKPESEWRVRKRWYSWLPSFLHAPFRPFWRDRYTFDEIVMELEEKVQIPGWTNAWTMPIKARIDMLSTGIRTPIGVKVSGADLYEIEKIGIELETLLQHVPGTRSVYAERVVGGFYIDYEIRRTDLARYGLSVADVQQVISIAIGGMNVTTTIEGRERYPVNVRYARDFRDSIDQLSRVLIPTPGGAHIPISAVADIEIRSGPAMIRNEDGMLTGYVYVDLEGRDIGSWIKEARRKVSDELQMPPNYTLAWSGQYENMKRVRERLVVVIPITLTLIIMLIYMNTRSMVKTGIILTAVPLSAIGAIWILFLLDYNMSIAVWVGLIALLGLDAEMGIFMLLYLDLAYEEHRRKGLIVDRASLINAIIDGAVKRVRPKVMTVGSAIVGLMPIMWSLGAGADVMKRIAAPMIGGLTTSFLLELLIYPVLFAIWKERELKLKK